MCSVVSLDVDEMENWVWERIQGRCNMTLDAFQQCLYAYILSVFLIILRLLWRPLGHQCEAWSPGCDEVR